ncbi:SGNH/GDSL hydrolase family protein [Hymenobacter saemangeumensis]|uniref:SGNH/GDSL hydrolase family protein n=1 Tax=Hymenobacter saemangeumensis TaxID=1084522 RepID=A0ABP8I6C6_9BACT
MNQNFKRSAPFLALLGLVLGGCQPDLSNDPKSSAGQADFSRYIAVGNSLTAGFSDNGLYREGQLNSYPSILAQQFSRVGGGTFVQPLFTEAQASGSGYVRLAGFTTPTANSNSSPITAPVAGSAGRNTPTSAPYTKFTEPVNNLGIPGIRMSDINTAGYGSTQGNPYFERITPDAMALQTYLQRVQATVGSIKPTFFTSWLGNNDVLGYATAGAAANAITPLATFTTNNNQMLDALISGGAKGVVATIPDVTGIPFFTTAGPSFRATLALPANNVPSAAPFVYTTGTLAPGQPNTRVNTTLASIRDASGAGNLLLTLTASPYLGLYGRPSGKYWRDFYQQARPSLPPTIPNLSTFLLVMGVDTTRAFGQTTQNPFPSTLVLDDVEQTAVVNATNDFNRALISAANARNLAIFDANTFFRGVAANGIMNNTIMNSAAFISGNLFSLDGVHPTPRGYAFIANEMIKAINAKYDASIPTVDATKYRGVQFPR